MSPSAVKIVEVGPRDGLQNERDTIPTNVKINFINQLSETGLTVIEAGSFVSPKWVPQLADTEQVFQQIHKKNGVSYPVLVPNIKGLERALRTGVNEIAVFTTASETFSQKNTNCSIAESLMRIAEITAITRTHGIKTRGYISCVLGCPYEGDIKTESVIKVAKKLFELGCYEISLGDTIGIGTAKNAVNLIKALSKFIPLKNLAVHFHDTYGQALANIYACLEFGVRTVDSAVAGLGGCPYAPGASGNVATEDVIYLLNGLGTKTGVDLEKLAGIGRDICRQLRRQPASKANQALLAKQKHSPD